jgi:hypothetical protein
VTPAATDTVDKPVRPTLASAVLDPRLPVDCAGRTMRRR